MRLEMIGLGLVIITSRNTVRYQTSIMTRSVNPRSNRVRIVAGEHRSRHLEFPSLEGLRPTPDRVRETLFNWLRDTIQGETCLDLFAGSGALGFEALSRGASHVDFVEKNTAAANSIRENLERLDAKNANVYCADAFDWLKKNSQTSKQYGLVFLDPPFKGGALARAIGEIEWARILGEGGLVYIEKEKQSNDLLLPEHWVEQKSKKAGSIQFGLYKIESGAT
jgi:16S rRNA (guanine966-N2)-methyltransferase